MADAIRARRAQKPPGPVSAEGREIRVVDRLRGKNSCRLVEVLELSGNMEVLELSGNSFSCLVLDGGDGTRHTPVGSIYTETNQPGSWVHATPPESGAQSSPGGSPVDGPSDAAGSSPRGAADSPGLSFPEYPEHPAYAISSPSPRAPDPGPREQLAAFEAAVAEHLVPRLPKGWRVVTDTCRQADEEHGDYNGFALFVLDGKRVVYHDSYDKPITARDADAMRMSIAAGEFDLTRLATGERRS